MKQYVEDKHFDLSNALIKNQAYFEDIDFSETPMEQIRNIFSHGISDITFDKCLFSNLDFYNFCFDEDVSFYQCTFKGQTNFSRAVFRRRASFISSVFDGITEFNNTVFKDADFDRIKARPAGRGYFYFRGDEINPLSRNEYYNHSYSFRGAIFECEVSFLGRTFIGNVSFARAEFHNKFWFTETDIGLKSNFHNLVFKCDGIKDIDICYRILIDALRKANNDRQANQISILEEKAFKKAENADNLLPEKVGKSKFDDTKLLDTKEAAEYLGLQSNTLEKWRHDGREDLKYIKVGRMVRYKLEDLQEYISGNKN